MKFGSWTFTGDQVSIFLNLIVYCMKHNVKHNLKLLETSMNVLFFILGCPKALQ